MRYPTFVATALTFALLGTGQQDAAAQRISAHGPVPLGELITLSRHTPFDQALRVLRTYSDRVIVDPAHHTQPISVDVDRQPWLRALIQIAKTNGLQLVEHVDYYEVLPEPPGSSGEPDEVPRVNLDSREVSISAVFFQADRSAIRELGINWNTLSGGKVEVRTSNKSASMVTGEPFSLGVRSNMGKSMHVDALLKAFETNNTGEVVASPQVKVQNGRTGYIQVGSDFSVTTADYAGNAITQFHSTGTILTVTPAIISQEGVDFVDLDVEAERSSLVDPVRNLISKTVARTSALLRDGEQTAIGGLYGQEVSESRKGIPLLKNLPGWFFGLRYLFGHNTKQSSKTELVVLLKVEIAPSVRERAAWQPEEHSVAETVNANRSAFEKLLRQLRGSGAESKSTP
jgi:general secretion pathway protein D